MSEPSGLPQPDDQPPRRRKKRMRRKDLTEAQREHRRLRTRRRGRRAYIRSAYSLPSLATLGNAIFGFAAVWVAMLDPNSVGTDPATVSLVHNRFIVASYFIFISMLFDAVDGRLARLTRHTTDFGGQLDSLADVVSFGFAPMAVALKLFHDSTLDLTSEFFRYVSRTVWCIGALYLSCAMIRLARFNVSNKHGEEHHFSFLGLPSPGAAAVVASFILMQQDLLDPGDHAQLRHSIATTMVWVLPVVVLCAGLLMVSTIRYPHLVNRYLRGKRSIQRLVFSLMLLLLLVIIHRYTLGIGTLVYAIWGVASWAMTRARRRGISSGLGNV